jgi:molecular chaperone GrpE
MISLMEKQGVESLSAEGEEFDPDKHEALMQVEKENVESGKIIKEHLRGYTLNGKVIRHSQVIVAK